MKAPSPPSASKEELAKIYFKQGFNCAQSVFAPFAAELGLSEKDALRLSSGFGAGFGRMREICGALSALTLIIGYREGNEDGNAASKEHIYSLIQKAAADFRAEFSAIHCRDLLPKECLEDQSTKPEERSASYYAKRPCEACVAYCSRQAAGLWKVQKANRSLNKIRHRFDR